MRGTSTKPLLFATALVGAGLALQWHAPLAGADVFTVTTSADSGAGSLRAALAAAEANGGEDTVTVQPGLGPILLESQIEWTGGGSVIIEGNGVTIDAGGTSGSLFDEAGAGLTFADFTFTGYSGGGAGAPIAGEGPVSIADCNIFGNDAVNDGDVAGAVLSQGGSVSVDNCEITGNFANTSSGDAAGGVLSEGGPVQVLNSLIAGNEATTVDGDVAGGVLSEGGPVTLRATEVSCNFATAESDGDAVGGVLSEGGNVTINDSALLGNDGSSLGGGAEATNLLTLGGTESVSNTEISDDPASCQQPTPTTQPPTTVPGTTVPVTTVPVTTTTVPAPTGAQPVSGQANFTG